MSFVALFTMFIGFVFSDPPANLLTVSLFLALIVGTGLALFNISRTRNN